MDPQRIRLEQGVLIRYLNILLSYVVSMLGILCQLFAVLALNKENRSLL